MTWPATDACHPLPAVWLGGCLALHVIPLCNDASPRWLHNVVFVTLQHAFADSVLRHSCISITALSCDLHGGTVAALDAMVQADQLHDILRQAGWIFTGLACMHDLPGCLFPGGAH